MLVKKIINNISTGRWVYTLAAAACTTATACDSMPASAAGTVVDVTFTWLKDKQIRWAETIRNLIEKEPSAEWSSEAIIDEISDYAEKAVVDTMIDEEKNEMHAWVNYVKLQHDTKQTCLKNKDMEEKAAKETAAKETQTSEEHFVCAIKAKKPIVGNKRTFEDLYAKLEEMKCNLLEMMETCKEINELQKKPTILHARGANAPAASGEVPMGSSSRKVRVAQTNGPPIFLKDAVVILETLFSAKYRQVAQDITEETKRKHASAYQINFLAANIKEIQNTDQDVAKYNTKDILIQALLMPWKIYLDQYMNNHPKVYTPTPEMDKIKMRTIACEAIIALATGSGDMKWEQQPDVTCPISANDTFEMERQKFSKAFTDAGVVCDWKTIKSPQPLKPHTKKRQRTTMKVDKGDEDTEPESGDESGSP